MVRDSWQALLLFDSWREWATIRGPADRDTAHRSSPWSPATLDRIVSTRSSSRVASVPLSPEASVAHPRPCPAISFGLVALAITACGVSTPSSPFTPPTPSPSAAEAPVGFDNKSNGMVDDSTHDADRTAFDEVEDISDGLGPLYNAQSCRECHQNPTSGGPSQVSELRVGQIGRAHV